MSNQQCAILPQHALGVANVAIVSSTQFALLSCNARFCQIVGYTKEQLLCQFGGNVLSILGGGTAYNMVSRYCGQSQSNVYEFAHSGDLAHFAVDSGGLYTDEAGRLCAQLLLTEIDGQNAKAYQDLLEEQQRYNIALRASKICVFEVDAKAQLYTHFDNAGAIFAKSGDEILRDVQPFSTLPPDQYQQAVLDYFSHSDDTQVVQTAFESVARGEPTTYEARMRVSDNMYTWCKITVTPICKKSQVVRLIGVVCDVNVLKTASENYKQQSYKDSFTGLLNKVAAKAAIDQSLRTNPQCTAAFVLIDIDNFKQVNDQKGHKHGDFVLKNVVKQLRLQSQSEDILCRFGGDEFIVFIPHVQSQQALSAHLNSIIAAGTLSGITLSAGVALYPGNGQCYDTLLENADAALYQAKKTKNTYVVF